jgi:hypothetical protein
MLLATAADEFFPFAPVAVVVIPTPRSPYVLYFSPAAY